MVFRIKWPQGAPPSYLHGSYVSFIGNKVVFDNALMSPGFSLMSWTSRTNYQANRIQPSLPLLERGRFYQLDLQAVVKPANSLYVKVTYFDRLGQEIGVDVLKEQSWIFQYPITAFYYTLELLNAGCEYLAFDQILLFESLAEQKLAVDVTDLSIYFPKVSGPLHVLFLEPATRTAQDLPLSLLEELGNVILVGDRTAMTSSYLARDFEKKLSDYLWFYHDKHPSELHFIAYGRVGALAALHYGAKHGGQTYLDQPLVDQETYRKTLVAKGRVEASVLSAIFDRLAYATTVTYYTDSKAQAEFPLISSCFDRAYRLVNLSLLTANQG